MSGKESLSLTAAVSEERLAVNVGSGDLRVLATPSVAALMEGAAAKLAEKYLDEGFTTVGTEISIMHISPTPFGAEFEAKATLAERDGRLFRFEIEASDRNGLIAEGTHSRFAVKADKFQEKADAKFNEV